MPDSTKDLWPELNATFRSPVTIMREQAAILASKTNGLLSAEVVSQPSQEQATFLHHFIIVAQALNYRYTLLIVRAPIVGYPARLVVTHRQTTESATTETAPHAKLVPTITAKDEDEFLTRLRAVLNAERTKNILNALLSQSAAP